MGDGTRENPYTREDVLRLIEENGDTAIELDLSGKVFEKGVDLRYLNLEGIVLEKAYLEGARLEGAKLDEAHLEEANLVTANLQEADLVFAYLERANLGGANLKKAYLAWANLDRARLNGANLRGTWLDKTSFVGAYLTNVTFYPDTYWGNIKWGNYILGDEADGFFFLAADTYRSLKVWHINAGMYDIAGEFFFREMTAKRKMLKWWPNPFPRVWSKLLSILCGYGEKPLRVIGWAASVILGLALIYFIIGSIWEWSAFWNSLYFSSVSFTALGYGRWAPQPTGWVKGLGAFEAFIGVFMIALFLITFVRKMTR